MGAELRARAERHGGDSLPKLFRDLAPLLDELREQLKAARAEASEAAAARQELQTVLEQLFTLPPSHTLFTGEARAADGA